MLRYFIAVICLGITTSLQAAPTRANGPLAAPGLHVPDSSLPYALDEVHGKPELVPIHHSTVIVNNHRGSNTAGELAGSFFYKPKLTTELAGVHARVQLHTEVPVFYLHMATDTDDAGDSAKSDVMTWALVRAKIKHDRRILSTIRFTSLTGHAHRNNGMVDIQIQQLPGGWIRITPNEPLTLDEYALMPVPRVASTFSVVVFDFGIDPSAPAAKDAIPAQP